MKGKVISNNGEQAIVELENGVRLAIEREKGIDCNEINIRPPSKEEFLRDMAVGTVRDGWVPQDARSVKSAMQAKKLYDTEDSEWAFRLSIQISNLSKAVLHTHEEQKAFDEVRTPLFESMRECFDVQLELNKFIDTHLKEVAAGHCVEVRNGNIVLLQDIEPTLNRLFKDFFVKARTVLYHLFGQKAHKKQSSKSVVETLLGHDLGFVQIEDDAKFEQKAQEFLRQVPGAAASGLIDMIRGDRKTWSSGLINIRNTIIHDVTCPRLKMTYMVVNGMVRVGLPRVNKIELRKFVGLHWDNLCDAVEETIVASFNVKLSPNFLFRYIPEGSRDPHCPMRYEIVLRPDNIPPGVIVG